MADTGETKKQTLTQKLTKGLKRNVTATVNLTASITQAFKQQGEIAKTFISTGNRNAISSDNLSTTFSTVGLSLSQTLSNFQAMTKVGIDITSKGNRDLFARYSILGADTRGLAKMMALNEQTLGLSNQRSRDLGDSLVETAAANGFSSDVLVQAMNSLSQTFIRASAVYGKETSIALQEASRNLIGKYGAGNADLIKEMTSKLFAGTAESTKMASMLGLDISKLATQDTGTAQALIEQAITSIGDKIGGAAGQGSSGFTVSKLLTSFGNITPGMLALAKIVPLMGESAVVNAETLAQQTLQNDLQATLNTIMKDFTILILPALNSAAKGLVNIATAMTFGNGLLGKLIIGVAAAKVVQMTFSGIYKMLEARKAAKTAQILMLLTQIELGVKMGNRGGAMAAVGRGSGMLSILGGPWGLAIGAALMFLPMLFSNSEDENETSKDILSEQEKQTAALTGESATSRILSNISRSMIQSNLFNEQILLNSQEHLEVVVDAANTPVEGTTQVGNLYENPPS